MNIAVARASEVMLPAIDLVRVGEHYFVRDGHHRVSVAKFQGQMEIEANVIEWHCAAAASDPISAHLAAKPTYLGFFTLETIGQLSSRLSEQLNVVGAKIRRELYATCQDPSAATQTK